MSVSVCPCARAGERIPIGLMAKEGIHISSAPFLGDGNRKETGNEPQPPHPPPAMFGVLQPCLRPKAWWAIIERSTDLSFTNVKKYLLAYENIIGSPNTTETQNNFICFHFKPPFV